METNEPSETGEHHGPSKPSDPCKTSEPSAHANVKSSYEAKQKLRLTHPSASALTQGNVWSVHTRAVHAERLLHGRG